MRLPSRHAVNEGKRSRGASKGNRELDSSSTTRAALILAECCATKHEEVAWITVKIFSECGHSAPYNLKLERGRTWSALLKDGHPIGEGIGFLKELPDLEGTKFGSPGCLVAAYLEVGQLGVLTDGGCLALLFIIEFTHNCYMRGHDHNFQKGSIGCGI
jgi:hypothetical protein